MSAAPDSALALPDGRRVVMGADVAPLLLCGVLVAEDATVADDRAIAPVMAARAAELREVYAGRSPGSIPVLEEARRLYRATGVDPTRTRPSSEALLRRALKEQPLPSVNNAVDCVNLASLDFLLSIGLYDLDRVRGDATVRLGRAGEEYPGIRKGPVHLEGRLGVFDAAGPFGSPTSDSARTAVDATTRRLLAVIFATAAYPESAMTAHIDLLASLLERHCLARMTARGLLRGDAA
jgi:DNA/RNA-binding domain of Phe-tRNA-synthetase-like protein